jgi:hypothetical protein
MANSARAIHVGLTGQIHTAPVGSRLPTTADEALDVAFVDLGYTTTDGVRFGYAPETQDIEVWQADDPVRVIAQRRPASFETAFAQLDENTLPVALGGGVVRGSGGNFTYTPPAAQDGLEEQAIVVDIEDGDKKVRFVVARAVVTEAVEISFNKEGLSSLPVNFRVLRPDTGSAWEVFFADSSGS